MWPDATRFLLYKDVIQVELKSTQPNHVFCPMVPLKETVIQGLNIKDTESCHIQPYAWTFQLKGDRLTGN